MPVSVYLIPGMHLNPGERPTRYNFSDEFEADAFRRGISVAMGWMEIHEVTGPNVRVRKDGTINPDCIKEVFND